MQESRASVLANNMAELSARLQQIYLQYQTRSLNETGLREAILAALNNTYPEDLVMPIIQELELRYRLQDEISLILTDNKMVRLTADQLVLDADSRINLPETIRQYYQQQLVTKQPVIRLSYCAIFGLTEFIGNCKFLNDNHREQQLTSAFYLAALHGHLEFMQKIWEFAAAPIDIQAELISHNNFSVVAASRASLNPEIHNFILACIDQVSLQNKVTEFSDEDMFPIFARTNNIKAMLECWKKPRTPQAYLALLSKNQCKIFDDIADECKQETIEALLNCLIALKKTEKIAIPNDVWQNYFRIAVTKSTLSSVKKIWNALDDETFKGELLNESILSVSNDLHVPALKFILEQAESFRHNPIDSANLEGVRDMAQFSEEQLLGELLAHSPLLNTLRK